MHPHNDNRRRPLDLFHRVVRKTYAKRKALIIQFIKFGIVGTIGFVIDAGVLVLCMQQWGMGPYSGRAVSFMGAVTVTWMCNRHFTFRGQSNGHPAVQWLKFVITNIGGFALNYGTYASLVASTELVAAHPVLGVAAGSIAGMFVNFASSKKLVFR